MHLNMFSYLVFFPPRLYMRIVLFFFSFLLDSRSKMVTTGRLTYTASARAAALVCCVAVALLLLEMVVSSKTGTAQVIRLEKEKN